MSSLTGRHQVRDSQRLEVSAQYFSGESSLSLSHNRWISERLGLEYLFTCLHTRCSRLQTFPDWSWDQMCKNSHFYSKIFFWCTIKILFYSFASVWEGSPATSSETLIFLSHLSASLSKDLKEHKTKLKFTLRKKLYIITSIIHLYHTERYRTTSKKNILFITDILCFQDSVCLSTV